MNILQWEECMSLHLICENAILVSAPQIGEPIETGNLELLEFAAFVDVVWLGRELCESRPTSGVGGALGRDCVRSDAGEVAVDFVLSPLGNEIMVFPSRLIVTQPFPLAQVFDCKCNAVQRDGLDREGCAPTMLMWDVPRRRSNLLVNDPLYLTVAFEKFASSLALNLESLDVFGAEGSI